MGSAGGGLTGYMRERIGLAGGGERRAGPPDLASPLAAVAVASPPARRGALLLLAVALTAAASARAAGPNVAGPRAVGNIADVPRVELPAVDLAALAAADAAGRGATVPNRFAAPIPTSISAANAGRWDRLPDGSWRWRLRLVSVGATSLNLVFSTFDVPPDGALWLVSPDGARVVGPLTARDRTPTGMLWTPILRGDDAVVELRVGARERDRAHLELMTVNHGFRDLASALGSLSCETDVVCPKAAAWQDEVRAVGLITLNGTGLCTGTLLDDTSHDFRPYFLTAAHCVADEYRAESIVVYWNFVAPVCGERGGGQLTDATIGSTLRASLGVPASDFTLLELSQRPDPGFNVFYAGWDASGAQPSSGAVISHPRGTPKIISFTDHAPTAVVYPGQPPSAPLAFWEVTYDDGTTDDGSSGACLFNQNHRCIGDLNDGTPAACPSGTTDDFARLSTAWDGGGAPTRLRDWLDHAGTGLTSATGAYAPRAPRAPRRLLPARPAG